MSDEQEYITITQVAAEMGWNKATVYDWIKTLEIEKHRFLRNKNTYIHVTDVQRLKEIKEKPWTAGPNTAKRDRNIAEKAEKAKKQSIPPKAMDDTKTTVKPQKATTTRKDKPKKEEVPTQLELLDGTTEPVPEGAVFHYEFARKFALNERTVRDWVDKHEIEAMIGKNPNRPKQKYRLLTLTQQYKAVQWLQERKPEMFTRPQEEEQL
ncbi:MAG TPA: hypothetical protein VHV10_04525 [Ktedonobacteraceae bacterium]|nr:hypothetical protein [Ktedonobacteraceae bacterium]